MIKVLHHLWWLDNRDDNRSSLFCLKIIFLLMMICFISKFIKSYVIAKKINLSKGISFSIQSSRIKIKSPKAILFLILLNFIPTLWVVNIYFDCGKTYCRESAPLHITIAPTRSYIDFLKDSCMRLGSRQLAGLRVQNCRFTIKKIINFFI